MDKLFKMYKNDFTYNLIASIKPTEKEELLELELFVEEDPETSYKFSGGLTNLIDQDKIWKKFEISEAYDLIKQNFDSKKIDFDIEPMYAMLKLGTIIFNKEISTSIKLIRSTKKESSKEDIIISLFSKITKLTNDIARLKKKKTEHIYEVCKNQQFYLTYPNKTFEFQVSFKYNGDVEFKFEMELNQNQSQSPWVCVSIHWENLNTKEKGENIIFCKNLYATPATQSGYYNLPTIKAKKLLHLKSGDYRLKLVLEQNTNSNNCLQYSSIKLISKSRY